MSLWLQLLLFGIPGILLYCGFYYWTPKLMSKGVPLIFSFWFFLWMPVILLLPLSIFLYWLDGGIMSISAFKERFHLIPIEGNDWFWVFGAVIFTIIFDQLLEPVGKYFARLRFFAPPSYLPAPFNPLKKFSVPPNKFFDVSLRKNWILLVLFVPIHIVAMFSEELMWRGYILPSQIDIFGAYAWIINGLLWAWVIHACLKWHFIGMLPGMLIAPWIAQHTDSTWASFAAHAIGNAPLWIILFIGILKSPLDKENNSVETSV
ncbi:CPBP family intramembrane metalloprotease [Paenibacillus sp. N1-5-1-14]|uniref:CPBP family intramembrane glutamic endopeptidase n=1 Tax=Paenibacillus radicibacter TaxID=2972488 RepID=UPI00215918B0|nr:CPBP family intramembrane glutamic endopeptidase [Paenibacillus radicibacter]MCR8645506.1 CPBP family intramembrane metalloprotease [Paenibacillus radicibacter]